jgi:protein-L-isoaspartate(D-aspartate) O-methyltransferase
MGDNKQLINSLIEKGVLKSERIIKAFQDIDRIDFVIDECKDLAYFDIALPIGFKQTISQPYTVAFMLELLDVKEGQEVLDIGTGSGWTTALLSKIVGQEGFVEGKEVIEDLVRVGRSNLAKYKIKNARITSAQKGVLGIPGKKFDRILISASANKFSKELLKQIKTGGVIVLPIKESIVKISRKDEESITKEEYYGFSFVPLVE